MTVPCALARPHARSVYGSLDFFAQLFVLRQKVEENKTVFKIKHSKQRMCLPKESNQTSRQGKGRSIQCETFFKVHHSAYESSGASVCICKNLGSSLRYVLFAATRGAGIFVINTRSAE